MYQILAIFGTLIVMTSTFMLTHWNVPVINDACHWTLIPVLIAEALLGGGFVWQLFDRRKLFVIPLGSSAVSAVYLIFTLLMFFPFSMGADFVVIRNIQVVAGTIFIVVQLMFLMAAIHAASDGEDFSLRKRLQLEVARFRCEKDGLLKRSPELSAKIEA